ncbi:BTAD domain-containing putative transcriptional regulator [Saccharothrix violaceirubra]
MGPVTAWDGGRDVAVGGGRARTLVAVLVFGGRRVVDVERIVDALWGEQTPHNARAAVQTHVSALRRVVGDVLVRRGGGYLLDAPSDLERCERLVADGRSAPAVDDRAGALSAALELWRGTPLGGTAGRWADDQRVRLEALWSEIHEDLFDAGGPVSAATLAGLVEAHPLRERLRSRWVLALSGEGRQSDALAAYRESRRVLVDELGVEPGAELRAAHDRALAGEPAAPSLATPGQLPPDIVDFTGRAAELDALTGRDVPLVAVSGKAGTGKSAFAVHLAHRLRDRYPDGVLHARLHGSRPDRVDPAEVLGRFVRALGVPPAAVPDDPDELSALYRTITAERRLLVVLDDAADERQARPLLPAGRCGCLITGRARPAALEGVEHVELGELDEEESLALLGSLVGADRAAAEPARARDIVRLCGRLPLAVRIAGARLAARRDWPLSRLARRLGEQRRLLDELAVGDLEVRGSLLLSYAGLTEPQRRALRRVGWLGVPDFTAWLVAVLLDVPVDEAEDVVDALVRAQLLDVVGVDGTGSSRYRPHDLTRAFAWERGEEEEAHADLVAAAERAAACWASLVERVSGDFRTWVLRPELSVGVEPPADWLAAVRTDPVAWFAAEQSALLAAVERLAELGSVTAATRLAAVLCASTFAVENQFAHWWRSHTAALDAARAAGDHAAQGLLLAGLGWLRSEQDRPDEAADYYAQATRAYGAVGDRGRQAVLRVLLGGVLRDRGNLTAALAEFDAAEPDLREPRALARLSHVRASTLTEVGDIDGAVRACDRAAEWYAEAGDEHGVGMAVRTRGIAHRAAGRLAEADRDCRQAHDVIRAAGNRLSAAYTAQALAKVSLRLGDVDEAAGLLDDAYRTCHEMQDGFGQALVLRTLGELDLVRSCPTDARAHLTRSVRWWDALGLPLWRARCLRDLATAADQLHLSEQADAERAEALALFTRHGSREAREPLFAESSQSSLRTRP